MKKTLVPIDNEMVGECTDAFCMHRPLTAASLVTRRTSRLVTTTPSRSLFTRTQSAQQPQRAYKMSAIPQLLANNEQFSTTFKQQYPELLAQLGKTQKPKVCWLGCADSRVPPELATGVQPGDIFVHVRRSYHLL